MSGEPDERPTRLRVWINDFLAYFVIPFLLACIAFVIIDMIFQP